MTTRPSDRPPVTDRQLTQAMAACLRLILNDLWTQYRIVRAAAEQLKNAGGAASKLYREVCGIDKVAKSDDVENSNRGIRRSRV